MGELSGSPNFIVLHRSGPHLSCVPAGFQKLMDLSLQILPENRLHLLVPHCANAVFAVEKNVTQFLSRRWPIFRHQPACSVVQVACFSMPLLKKYSAKVAFGPAHFKRRRRLMVGGIVERFLKLSFICLSSSQSLSMKGNCGTLTSVS